VFIVAAEMKNQARPAVAGGERSTARDGLTASGSGSTVKRRLKIRVPMMSQKNRPTPNADSAASCQPLRLSPMLQTKPPAAVGRKYPGWSAFTGRLPWSQ